MKMNVKNKVVCKGILLFIVYALLVSLIKLKWNGDRTLDTADYITWGMWIVLGIWQSYRYTSRKLEDLREK